VSVEYKDGRPVRAHTVVVSSQHTPDVPTGTLKEAIIEEVVKNVIPPEFLDKHTVYYVNPTGRFVEGGPKGDCGLTGRKIIVDTYGGYGRHGGGAFSGKDPSKVDRSAAYMARYIAKNIVAAELARRCEIQVAYAIGVAEPVSIVVDTFGTGAVPDDKIAKLVREVFDLKPAAIIQTLGLKQPIYQRTASYGHFGRVPEGRYFTWERTDKVDDLRSAAGLGRTR
jgi:S-adenosylmethionine synthetase